MRQAAVTAAEPNSTGLIPAARKLGADFWRFAGPRRSWSASALMLAGALAEGMSLVLIVPLVATIAYPAAPRWQRVFQPLCDGAGLCSADQRLPALLALFVAAFTLRAVVLAARDRVVATLEAEFVEQRRIALVRALAGSRWEELAGLHHARLTYLLAAEVQRLATAVRQLATTTMSVVMLLGQWLLLALIAWPMALLFLAAALVALVAGVPALRRAWRVAQDNRRGNAAIVNLAQQLLGGLKLALAQNLQHAFVTEMEQASSEILRRNQAYERRAGRGRIGGSLAAAVALAAMAWLGVQSGIPAARLVAAIAVFVRMLGPGAAVLRSLRMLAQSLPAYGELLGMEAELGRNAPAAAQGSAPAQGSAAAQGPAAGLAPEGELRFCDVGFVRPGGGVRFEQLDLRIAPGSLIGVIGPSGAGKTTFVDLLCGLLSPQAGQITVGGQQLTGPWLNAWRSRIAYVAQDSYLFNDSLRRNLTWGLERVSDEQIAQALATAEADGIVAALPLGLDQPVGERGLRLSGGERQRLALARALIRRPALLVLDEATNALDLPSEARILARLAALDWRPSVIMVAHRPEALAQCSRILRFDGGILAEDRTVA